MSPEPMRNGDAALIAMLKKMSLVTDSQADMIAVKSRQQGASIDATAVQLGIITEEKLVEALTQECWIPHLKVGRYEIRQEALDVICQDDAVHYDVFPVDRLGLLLTLAMVNPLDIDAVSTLEAKTGLRIKKVVATRSEVAKAISKYYRSP